MQQPWQRYYPEYFDYGINAALHNLNHAVLHQDAAPYHAVQENLPLEDHGRTCASHGVTVHFRDLAARLRHYIAQADIVVGCVAWLTDFDLLATLADVPYAVSLIVQKEDFLRPDIDVALLDAGGKLQWARKLRAAYERLPYGLARHQYHARIAGCSVCSDPGLDPVRCVGNFNHDRHPSSPRMHNKFLVFCRRVLEQECPGDEYDEPAIYYDFVRDEYDKPPFYEIVVPYAVWTGSFNLTVNATQSLENAVYFTIPVLAEAYFQEWGQIAALSEPLDWEYEWCAPEWRIGT